MAQCGAEYASCEEFHANVVDVMHTVSGHTKSQECYLLLIVRLILVRLFLVRLISGKKHVLVCSTPVSLKFQLLSCCC